jgi:chromosome segregation protein
MTYIKKIEVNGFKTFGRKTTLLFDKGFTAITGPNGSGKTNIIDAVLFGLGELSARRLRTSNFSSLIFHGNPNPNIRKKNKAKVIIQFDNSDGRLPPETSTVTVSREIDQNGQSVYRINGRRVSRSYVLETLSLASISPYGNNVILQGALTRIAEISPSERRKIIEDIIGIAQYDAEKTEAEEKLKTANISLKTALGQVGEVQRRVESLERERNDLFRHNFIQMETKHLEAIRLSCEIKNTEEKIKKTSSENRELEARIENTRQRRENLRSKRHDIETEWRKLGSEKVEENQTGILKVQMRIGELRSRLSEITTKMSAGKANISGFTRAREKTSQQIESVKSEIKESKPRIKKLIGERDILLKEIAEKQLAYNALSSEAAQVRSNLEEEKRRIREVEEQLDQIYREGISFRSNHAESNSRIDVYTERRRNINEKKSDLTSSLEAIKESLTRLLNIQKEQMDSLRDLQRDLERRTGNKKTLETEIKDAGKIAEIAREALVEFEAQRELVEKVNTEETALKHVEELGELGIIKGIHGRLKNLIKTRKGYERALEVAAAGWLDSMVVQNLDVAFSCVETLKQLKLGRIKIIPLQGLSPANQVDQPRINGIKGKVSTFVKYDEKYASVVSFILGDTLLASNGKAALAASRKGIRSVTLRGDLFEAGGGVESGFYRTPLDLSSFVPSKSVLKSLDKVITILKNNLSRRETDIGNLENEIKEIQEEITKLAETLGKLGSEIGRVRKSIHQTKLNIDRAEKNTTNLQNLLKEEKIQVELYEKRRDVIADKEKNLQERLAGLKKKVGLLEVQERERSLEELGNETITLRRKCGSIETELSTLQSKMKNVLKPVLENASIQRTEASRQISIIEKQIEESIKEKGQVVEKIEELKKNKQDLSSSLLNAKGEAKKFASQIDDIDSGLRILEKEYEQTDKVIDELRLNLQTFGLHKGRLTEQLTSLGYEEPLEVSSEQIHETEALLGLMRFELERIGAVNQLALTQYEEQASRYKELSIRMNELERERISIMDFVEGIEQKKRNAFMEAFNQINERIDKYFSKLTDGGNAALELEKPEKPFTGGVEMVVQFVGKPPIAVSGASSGERSVSAVAFLFALQEFTPASFYLLDEIDAHLDAFHVERLGRLLVEEAGKSQFLVVTLKPEMVSKADRIYGVYGLEGVSHVVSTTFKEAAR